MDNEKQHKDEICSKCKAVLLAHIHFVRCDESDCPMRSPNPKSVLEMLLDD